MFQDQTEATERRVKLLYCRSDVSEYSSPQSQASFSSKDTLSAVSILNIAAASGIRAALTQQTEQLALGYFFNKFVLLPRHSDAARGFIEVLPLLYMNAFPNSALSSATMAISLAAYANDPTRKVLFQQSKAKYGEALVRMNEALQDPVAVRKDETLMTVLLLGLLEVSLFDLSRPVHCSQCWICQQRILAKTTLCAMGR